MLVCSMLVLGSRPSTLGMDLARPLAFLWRLGGTEGTEGGAGGARGGGGGAAAAAAAARRAAIAASIAATSLSEVVESRVSSAT